MTLALRRMMTKTLSSTEPPALSGGKRADRVANLSNVPCTPVDPVDPRNEIAQRLGLDSPVELYQSVVYSCDIKTGDAVTIDAVTYIVRGMGPFAGPTWARRSEAFMALYLERAKR